ncbi:MAG TPA: PqqD family protein [Methylomirabilota bacterium]|nr:PqqD family protein [Methylomirabilota bacterium]
MRLQKRMDLKVRVVDGETVVFDRQRGLVHQLNQTASYIWERCDGCSSVEDIAAELQQTFDITYENAVKDVSRLIDEFQQRHLLEPAPDAVTALSAGTKEDCHSSRRRLGQSETDDAKRGH